MKKYDLREQHEETNEEETTTFSKVKVKRICESGSHRALDRGSRNFTHTKEVLSDGWTRWVCLRCGQVKFSIGITYDEEMIE